MSFANKLVLAPWALKQLADFDRLSEILRAPEFEVWADDGGSKETVQAAVRLAKLQPQCAAIVILFDGEDDCPKELGETVRAWAKEAAGDTLCDVVIAYREYETWFLAALESLRGKYGIRDDAAAPANPESRRDAKGWLEDFMPRHRAYSETSDQAGMSDAFDMGLAHQRNRSFRKLVKALGDLLTQIGQPLPAWPPANW
jgi:hypothetical protein